MKGTLEWIAVYRALFKTPPVAFWSLKRSQPVAYQIVYRCLRRVSALFVSIAVGLEHSMCVALYVCSTL